MEVLIFIVFALGYIAITLEHSIKINKAAIALLTGVVCWTIYILNVSDKHLVSHELSEHLGEISQILFFLLGAMTIVELIDAHDGFQVITDKIRTKDARKLIWILALITFFLSAVLDNLTTTIVIISLLGKIISDKKMKLFFAGVTVIAANAGGAWSPLGDVTTTMLWVGGQISPLNTILHLILPSFVCLLVPLVIISFMLKGKIEPPVKSGGKTNSTVYERNMVFYSGLAVLLFVPVFKTITHLPPYMGMLFGLGFLWVITEIIHSGKSAEDKDFFTVVYALRKIDTPSILFFLGILLSIASLQVTGQLGVLANWLNETIGNEVAINTIIGLLSAVVDNVPLVAAAQGMYSLDTFSADSTFWQLLAYATGTGGSVLIIGSAAGVAAMGIEKIEFMWYLKRISWLALIGYLSGIAIFVLQKSLF